ncbi:hypothetical protein FK529_04940 [Tsukamurella asaccharolytica]|uniref:DUF3987 domain-containing protein n=1 Tax=Tsukamurella asaccharolytica TaxID=2592067 RepID=A0A5C5RCE1_9ACTN|nr:hypothetical protein [Tsukamurella asaccharolytica]TWS20689.1 hypothetical protein FK529_04940 [Tsukamurella asaccharolytica]
MTAPVLNVLLATMRRQPSLALGYLGTVTDQSLREHLVAWLVENEREQGGVLADYTVWDTVLDLESGTVPSAEEAADLREVLDEELAEWARTLFADADALRREAAQLAQEAGTKPDTAVWQAFDLAAEAVRETTGGPDWGAGSAAEQQLEAMVQAERERLRAVPEVAATTAGGETAPLLPSTTAKAAEEPVTAQAEQSASESPEGTDDPEAYIPDPVGTPPMHAHVEDVDDGAYLDAVFCTPLLRELRARAEAIGVSPLAALAYLICTVADILPPHIMTVFDHARPLPMNLAWALLGPAGLGKGESAKIVERQVEIRVPDGTPVTANGGWAKPHVSPRYAIQSGQALAAEYLGEVKSDPLAGVLNLQGGNGGKKGDPKVTTERVQVSESRWIEYTEVGKLNKLLTMINSILWEELKAAVSGETLGGKTKTDPTMLRGIYRFILTVHAQDDKLGVLLEDLTGGLAQRLLFADAIPRTPFGVALPGKLVITLPSGSVIRYREPTLC